MRALGEAPLFLGAALPLRSPEMAANQCYQLRPSVVRGARRVQPAHWVEAQHAISSRRRRSASARAPPPQEKEDVPAGLDGVVASSLTIVAGPESGPVGRLNAKGYLTSTVPFMLECGPHVYS